MSNQSGEFDEMSVDEAIKFLDEYSAKLECEKCPVYSFDCVEHGCPWVRSVSAIKYYLDNTKGDGNNSGVRFLKANASDLERKEWTGDPDEFIDEVCAKCPLTRL